MKLMAAERPWTGRTVLTALLITFGIVFAVNGVFVYFAVSTWPGLSQSDAYEKGLRYNEVIRAALAQPEAQRRYGELGMVAGDLNRAEVAAFIRREAQRWKKVIEATGIHERIAPVGQHRVVEGRQRDGARKMRQRVGQPSGAEIRRAEIALGLGRFRIELDGLVDLLQRAAPVLQAKQNVRWNDLAAQGAEDAVEVGVHGLAAPLAVADGDDLLAVPARVAVAQRLDAAADEGLLLLALQTAALGGGAQGNARFSPPVWIDVSDAAGGVVRDCFELPEETS